MITLGKKRLHALRTKMPTNLEAIRTRSRLLEKVVAGGLGVERLSDSQAPKCLSRPGNQAHGRHTILRPTYGFRFACDLGVPEDRFTQADISVPIKQRYLPDHRVESEFKHRLRR